MRLADMQGKRFGGLMAIASTGRRNQANNLIWSFLCDCGRTCEIDGYAVRSGKRRNCQLCGRARAKVSSVTHGMSETPEFRTWTDIQTRCHNENSTSYPNYGGRGIKVCGRWRQSFAAFLDDMGPRPEGTSIDRYPDNNGDYEPGNCRWADLREQARNRRTNVRTTINGQTKTLGEWAHLAGLRPPTVYRRYKVGYRGPNLLQPLIKGGK